MRTVNGINIYWQTEDDLPSSCGSCPFYFDGSTSVPGVGSTQERGLCNLREMMTVSGFVSINFSGNMGIIKTRPGYASAIAWNIDSSDIPQILGSIAGDDTIFVVIREGVSHEEVTEALKHILNEH